MSALSIVFMGTPDFAVPSLDALVAAGHRVAAVYSQPPRPAGRGHRVQPSPVHARAEALGLPVETPTRLRGTESAARFAAHGADVAVVAAYGLILPEAVLAVPRLGCVNVHASLLPRWRGASPIQHALLAGDAETGISIMQMERGLDTGPVLLAERIAIDDPTLTADLLHDRLAALGARLIVPALAGLADGRLRPMPQPIDGVTYAPKLDRAAGQLAWAKGAAQVDRQVRALTPWPGAWFALGDERIKVLAVEPAPPPVGAPVPGTLLDARLTIACAGDQAGAPASAIRLARVQRPGRAAVDGAAFLRGFAVAPGTVLDGDDALEADRRV